MIFKAKVSGLNLNIQRQGFGLEQQKDHHGSAAAMSCTLLNVLLLLLSFILLAENLISNSDKQYKKSSY